MKKEKILLTFGIPMFNAELYIEELIQCFDFSLDFPYEVIIVNDGSTDKSQDICVKYHDKIRLINQDNFGVSCARNRIIDEAYGEWITFVDSDDLINFNEYIEEFKNMKNNGFDLIINVKDFKQYNVCMKKSDIVLPYLITNEIINSPCTKFFKKAILIKNNIRFSSNYSIGEDLLFSLSYYTYSKNVGFISNKLMYEVRMDNQNSLSRKYRINKFEELMSVNVECVKICNHYQIDVIKAIEYIRVKECLSCVKDIVLHPDFFPDPIIKIVQMKNYKKKQYFIMNDLKNTIIYNLWYLLPPRLILLAVKILNRF